MLSSFFLFLSFNATEIMFILFVALILFGGDKFPEIARGLGKGIREFKDMSDGVKREIHTQINNYDVNRTPETPLQTYNETPLQSHTDTPTETSVTPPSHEASDVHVETGAVPYETTVKPPESTSPDHKA